MKTARGGAFNKNSLHTILTNKKYIGIYKTKYGEIVGGIPAIIDKELFEMVALRMEQNKKATARAKAEIIYLLSTKLFCGKCRSAMVGESGTSKTGKKYYYYACVKKKREKACDITSEKYRQQLIDTFVHAVFVYDDKIVITYNYSGENNTATISDLDLSSPPLQSNPNIFATLDVFGLVVQIER